jgi:hypothetical protein
MKTERKTRREKVSYKTTRRGARCEEVVCLGAAGSSKSLKKKKGKKKISKGEN